MSRPKYRKQGMMSSRRARVFTDSPRGFRIVLTDELLTSSFGPER